MPSPINPIKASIIVSQLNFDREQAFQKSNIRHHFLSRRAPIIRIYKVIKAHGGLFFLSSPLSITSKESLSPTRGRTSARAPASRGRKVNFAQNKWTEIMKM